MNKIPPRVLYVIKIRTHDESKASGELKVDLTMILTDGRLRNIPLIERLMSQIPFRAGQSDRFISFAMNIVDVGVGFISKIILTRTDTENGNWSPSRIDIYEIGRRFNYRFDNQMLVSPCGQIGNEITLTNPITGSLEPSKSLLQQLSRITPTVPTSPADQFHMPAQTMEQKAMEAKLSDDDTLKNYQFTPGTNVLPKKLIPMKIEVIKAAPIAGPKCATPTSGSKSTMPKSGSKSTTPKSGPKSKTNMALIKKPKPEDDG